MRDIITIYDKQNWHWEFWAYRGDGSYTGLDYELGDAPDSGLYIIKSTQDDVDPEKLKQRFDNPIWAVLSAGLNGKNRNITYHEKNPVLVSEEETKKLQNNPEEQVQFEANLALGNIENK